MQESSIAKCKNHDIIDSDYDTRWELIKANNLSRQCLTKHPMKPPYNCKDAVKCTKDECKSKHHPLMHPPPKQTGQKPESQVQEAKISNSQRVDGQQLQFRYIPVILRNGDLTVHGIAFLDEGSNGTFMDEETAKRLELTGPRKSVCVSYSNGSQHVEEHSMKVSLTISGSSSKDKSFTLNCFTVKKLEQPKQTLDYNKLAEQYPHLRGLPVESYKDVKPQVMIGLDHWQFGVPIKSRFEDSGPVASKCLLGWTVYAAPQSAGLVSINHCCVVPEESKDSWRRDVHQMITDFMSIDSLGIQPPAHNTASKEEQRAWEILKNETKYDDKRYTTALLWRHEDVELPDSRPMARKRLNCLRARMARDQKLEDAMYEQIDGFLKKGYLRKLTTEEIAREWKRVWYLPLFPTKNPNKPDKFRVVADAKSEVNGVSLNTGLIKGPEIGHSLFGILLRWRRGKVAFIGDTKEMYQQVGVRLEDQHAQRVLFCERGSEQPSEYVFNVLTFGATCSPAIAKYVRDLKADNHAEQFPKAAKSIKRSSYMDDQLESVDTAEEAIQLIEDIIEVQSRANFEVRGWKSNSHEVMAHFGDKETQQQVAITMGDEAEKVLGMWWLMNLDCFTFLLKFNKGSKEVLTGQRPPTKREMLVVLMSLYDPLGLIAHYLAFLKVLLQDVWRSNCDWDEVLNSQLQQRWTKWILILPSLEKLQIPRCYLNGLNTWAGAEVQLHIMIDASQECCAAVAYLRIAVEGDVRCALVSAKTKVARLQLISIPRLEINAAVIGARLANSIITEMDLEFSKIVYWSDSKTALAWIRSDTRQIKGMYVAFRVAEIQDTTVVADWRYVPSRLNIADDATKWNKPLRVDINDRWFQGPPFLLKDESKWPDDISVNHNTDEEMRVVNVNFMKTEPVHPLFDYTRFSKWIKLVRVVATVQRAVHRFKTLKFKSQPRKKCVTVTELAEFDADEIQTAKEQLIRLSQQEAYPEEFKKLQAMKVNAEKEAEGISLRSKIYRLVPYLDEKDIMRAVLQLDNAIDIPFRTKRPIILDKDHAVTLLLVDSIHSQYHHRHYETVINEIRKEYKISQLRRVLQKMINKCPGCICWRTQPVPPKMAQLPAARVTPGGRPFQRVGIDCFGPMEVKVGRHHEKRWILIFVCMTVRAVHLEVLHGMDYDNFILAFRNFCNRRGQPKEVYSDNGTNFVKGERILREEFARIKQQSMGPLAIEGVKWIFNPAESPHMGGSWERFVGSAKRAYYSIKPAYAPSDPLFYSYICEVENILNSRPLTYLPIDSEEMAAITPNDLLRLDHGYVYPIGEFDDDAKLLRAEWMMAQMYANRFWKRWIQEALPELTRQSKWFKKADPLKPGDLVLIVDPAARRNYWERGRIDAVYKSRDGQVRSARVKTATRVIDRPAVKLARLDVEKAASPCKQVSNAPGGRMSQKMSPYCESTNQPSINETDRADLSSSPPQV